MHKGEMWTQSSEITVKTESSCTIQEVIEVFLLFFKSLNSKDARYIYKDIWQIPRPENDTGQRVVTKFKKKG